MYFGQFFLVWAVAWAAGTRALGAQTCPEGVVSRVVVANHSIFDEDREDGPGRFRWAYRLANRLHVRTREQFIRGELLLAEGDCYDPLLAAESERLLRDHRFIARAESSSSRLADGSWEVMFDTQDEWTTKVGLVLGNDDGLGVERLDVTEENLLGRGVLAGAFYRARDGRSDAGVRLELPRLLGTRTDARMAVGRTRGGDILEQSLTFPFVGEVGRFAGRQVFVSRRSSFTYVVGDDARVLLPLDEQRLEITLAGRLGRPGNLTVFGVGLSNETLEFTDFPTGVEITIDGSFDATRPADAATVAAVRPQTLHTSGTHVNLLAGQRNVRFARFRGLDALEGTQDVALGTDVALTLGKSVSAFSGVDDQPDDLYARLRVQAAAAPGRRVLRLDGRFEGRRIASGGDSGNGWTDALAAMIAQAYWQPAGWSRHTLVGRASAAGGWRLTQPFQLTLGGSRGVRGFREDELPGARRLVLNGEDRVYIGWPFPQLLDVGATAFGDVGRMWAGETPFGGDSGWKATVGAGLRLGLPAGSKRVARIDLAWPMVKNRLGSPIFRVALGDPIGLSAGLADSQMERSQRLAVGTDLFTERGR